MTTLNIILPKVTTLLLYSLLLETEHLLINLKVILRLLTHLASNSTRYFCSLLHEIEHSFIDLKGLSLHHSISLKAK